MRGHTDRAEAQMAVHVEALTKPIGELIDSVLRKHHRAVLEAVKELHDRCTKAESARNELAEALREARKYIYYRGLGTDDVTVYGDNPPFIEAILDPIDALLARIEGKS